MDPYHQIERDLLLLSSHLCTFWAGVSSSGDVPELQLGKYTVGYTQAPRTTAYTIPVSQCRPQKFILVRAEASSVTDKKHILKSARSTFLCSDELLRLSIVLATSVPFLVVCCSVSSLVRSSS